MAETPKVFRFYKISEANDFVAKQAEEIETLKSKLEAATSNDSEAVKAADQLQSDLTTARQTIGTLTKELEAAKADATTARAEATKAKADAESEKATIAAQVKTAAAAQAINIVSQVGVPATTATVSTGAAAPDFKALVEGQIKSGKSKTEAIAFCVKNHPDAYKAWRSGDTSKL